MFNETTRETLTEDINIATKQGELLGSSADFLLTKLQELSSSEGKFTSDEIKILEKQLNYHKQMFVYKNSFDIKKLLMRSDIEHKINNLLGNMHGKSIGDNDLMDLNCLLEQGLFNDSRDVIDDKLNNTDLSLEGLGDGFLNYKILGDFEITNNLLNYFTLELLENNILVDESRNIEKGQKVYSELSVVELNEHITTTVELLLSKDLSFPDNIELTHGNNVLNINLLKIKTELIAEENIRLEQFEKQRLKEERENNIVFLLKLLESQLSNTINSEGKEVLERKFKFTGNKDNLENEGYINLLNSYVSEGLIDNQYIINLYEEGNISKTVLLNFLEQDTKFNYLEFIETYGLTKRIQQQGLDYARNILKLPKELMTEEKINNPEKKIYPDELILKNLQIFISIFLNIESKGKNVKNQQGSSAKGYFQFLTLDGKYQKNKIEKRGIDIGDLKGGSFQTGLNRTRWVLPKDEFISRFGMQDSKKERDQNPMELSAENQTILFFANITGKDLYITNKGIDLNNDGAISDIESITNVGVDKNNDGIISGKEIKYKGIDVYGKDNNEVDGIIEYSERVRDIYNSKDLNGNGKIDKFEVKITKKWVDVNMDGKIQKNEIIERDPRKVARFMDGVLKENNEWSLGKVYKALHHRKPTKATLRVFEETINEYYYGNKKFIAKNHY